jgi:hypothetical protein
VTKANLTPNLVTDLQVTERRLTALERRMSELVLGEYPPHTHDFPDHTHEFPDHTHEFAPGTVEFYDLEPHLDTGWSGEGIASTGVAEFPELDLYTVWLARVGNLVSVINNIVWNPDDDSEGYNLISSGGGGTVIPARFRPINSQEFWMRASVNSLDSRIIGKWAALIIDSNGAMYFRNQPWYPEEPTLSIPPLTYFPTTNLQWVSNPESTETETWTTLP